ncbi:MAG: hypothetical protein OEU92_11320 [Alphaproteobacteria bacterium]|nr:hypothetical protein [Alphaproteobacteria bacterium]
MTIDPMAAVTSATGGVASPAAGVDPAASASATSPQQIGTQARVADQDAKTDLFDYASQQQNKPPAIDTLQPESRANYLSNPAALGEKVLERMESLHQRSVDYHNQLGAGPSSAAGGDSAMSGPAAGKVAGSAEPSQGNGYSGLKLVFDYAIETTMISNGSSQFVSSVNTLMRGQ